MGVAARLKQDIEVEAKDGQTGESIRVKTLDGQIASIEPATAIAWFGQKKGPDGNWGSWWKPEVMGEHQLCFCVHIKCVFVSKSTNRVLPQAT